jgi:glutathione S-transferase
VSDIRLYSHRMNPFTQKVAVGLDIKGLDYELVVSDNPDDIKRWSPVTGQLPVLEMDGKRLADSSAILRWLEEVHPEPRLWSRDPKTARLQEQMMEWSEASLLFYWDRWRAARYPQPGDDQPANPSLLAKLRRRIESSFGSQDRAPNRVELRELEVLDELAKRLDDLVIMLGQRRFFHADEPSIADVSVFGMLRIIRDGPMLNGAAMIERRPTLADYTARMDAISPSSAITVANIGE